MATTTNYSWSTPDDTALVKDGASAIRSLGTAIDTTVFNNAGAAIAKTIVEAKGDIIAATAADTVSILAVGANDTVLTADSSTATGLKWATPASGVTTVGCVLQGGSNQSVANDVLVILNFTGEIYDTNSMHDNVTNNSRVTIPSGEGGKYLINGQMAYAPGTANKLAVNIKKNGSTQIAQFSNGATGGDFDSQVPFAFVAALVPGDYLELEARQLSGGTINVKPQTSLFCVNKLGN